ncbi:MAG: hypothetical protein K2N90_09680 [Lachnospiraceae bacterium]|nr:hypothetical protein [Lachnospiraceae bacterium]
MDKLKKEFPRIYPYEEDAVRFWYVQYYYAALKILCEDMLEEIFCHQVKHVITLERKVVICYNDDEVGIE